MSVSFNNPLRLWFRRMPPNILMTQMYFPFAQFKQEHLYVLFLNEKQRITHEILVYISKGNSISIGIAELFREAVKQNAPLILPHSHSSVGPEPSPEDRA